jgi:hypothetical protein
MSSVSTFIYSPPRAGLPYLVVTLSEGAPEAVPAASRSEARTIAARRAILADGAEQPKRDGAGNDDGGAH